MPVALPSSIRTTRGSTRATTPVTTVPILSSKASSTTSRSASRRRCNTTCLAVCAATRPKLCTSCDSSISSPSSASGLIALASSRLSSVAGLTGSSTASRITYTIAVPSFWFSAARTFCSRSPLSRRHAAAIACSITSITVSSGRFFSSAMVRTANVSCFRLISSMGCSPLVQNSSKNPTS